MIVYVIKNEDKYYRNSKNKWTKNIKNCTMWNEEKDAYYFMTSCYLGTLPNTKVVKVEIREVEDE